MTSHLTPDGSESSKTKSAEQVDKEYERFCRVSAAVNGKDGKCRIYVNKLLKSKDESDFSKTKKTFGVFANDIAASFGSSALDESTLKDSVSEMSNWLGYTICGESTSGNVCEQCYALTFTKYLTLAEQYEWKVVALSAETAKLKLYQSEVCKIIRERQNIEEREQMAAIAEKKRQEEERRKKEEEEEAERQRLELEAQKKKEQEEKERIERERARLAVLKLEQKEKISKQQREFTNKELLEIVNDTEEGRNILEREKLRIQAEMEKVESMETLPELQRIGMRVELFTNLKKPQEMKCVEVTLSIADSDGKILESHDCWVDTAFEDNCFYKIFGAEVSFALEVKDIPENSAFLIELKHFKEKSNKKSTKCWSYVETRDVLDKITRGNVLETAGFCKICCPLAAKPTDPTRKMWVNYNQASGLITGNYQNTVVVAGFGLIAERKARRDKEMRNAVEMGKSAVNTEDGENGSTRSEETDSERKVETQKVTYIGSSKLRVFIHSFANIKEPELMDDVCVRLTLFNGNGEPKESVNCFPNKVNGGGVNRGILVFRTGITLTTILDSLEPGAFVVIELRHYKAVSGKESLKCWSFIDIQSLLPHTSNNLALCLLEKPVQLESIMRELKHSVGGKFISSIKPYGSKRNLDLKATFKFV